MNIFFSVVIHTANILGIFTDPFEFEGDYGPEANPVRQKVFELVLAKEHLFRNLSDSEVRRWMQKVGTDDIAVKNYRNLLVAQGIERDQEYGPILSELVTPELLDAIREKQQKLQSFTERDLHHILHFLDRYSSRKVFRFFRNNPPELLSLDKILRDKAAREGKSFALPILSSTQGLKGQNSFELKKDLLDSVFTEETLSVTKSEAILTNAIRKLDKNFLKRFLGDSANTQDLEVFCSPAGQAFFYWIYHALNLHLVSTDSSLIRQINNVKDVFARTLGNPSAKANAFKEKLLAADSSVVFTQESDLILPEVLMQDELFLPIDKQNPQDGCFIFLRRDVWEPNYEMIAIEGYEGFKEGKMNAILAARKKTGEKFLLSSCHGHSTKAEDGRLQISLVMEKFFQLSKKPENANLQLLIGIDANTKTEEDVKKLREHFDTLGLVATSVGPTTIKRRMVTAQHSKMGRVAIDEEDYLITLKPKSGGRFLLTHPTVGFKKEMPDINQYLPSQDNQSDHYPVGVTIVPCLP
ncbi:MAG: hypothetical protein HKM07_06235 [Chlamydiae bacterium]|nr:hypothetical protein [Chlamydiota bacterium]